MEGLGEWLRQSRLKRGLSQENVADELNMSVSGYSKIERGETDISVSRLLQISSVLGISPWEYVHRHVVRTPVPGMMTALPETVIETPSYHQIDFSEVNFEIRAYLISLARKRSVVDYQQLSAHFGLKASLAHRLGREKMGVLLSSICLFEHYESRPLLSVLVIDEMMGEPRRGFFKLARELGRFRASIESEPARKAFFHSEMSSVVSYWQLHIR